MIRSQYIFNPNVSLTETKTEELRDSLEQKLKKVDGVESSWIVPVEIDILPDPIKKKARLKRIVTTDLGDNADMSEFYARFQAWIVEELMKYREGDPVYFIHRNPISDKVRRDALFNWKKDAPPDDVVDIVSSLRDVRAPTGFEGTKSAQISTLERDLVSRYFAENTPYSRILTFGFDRREDALTFNKHGSHTDWGDRFKRLRDDDNLFVPYITR